ncbi:EAL and GGDEF domain-containing protein [Crocosphaera sp. XPORK-15E]|uniref:sensor domain-containing protein n=1 Tax=Crocosphaera sp. XPORK-15E TaxID=3110247 RepID=UPI002B1FF13B|nr:EAL domain-containing protein [Crocosphaera sp. XPORK-15E]MEA5536187.1 EAL domain-containing protein [Crocosphaera sp. XPORK-15E]
MDEIMFGQPLLLIVGGILVILSTLLYFAFYGQQIQLIRKTNKNSKQGKAESDFKEIRKEPINNQKELLQIIVDNIPIMLAFFDKDYNVKWINKEWENVLGSSLEDIKKRDILAELYPDPIYRQYVINFIKSAQQTWGDFKTTLPNGTILDTAWMNIRLSDGSNIGIGQDISKRKEMELALQKSEAKYRLLFEENPHPLWVYDLETLQFLEVNEAAIKHYGYSREEFLEMTIENIRPASNIPMLTKFLTTHKNQINKSGVWQHKKRHGELIYVEITSQKIMYLEREARLVLVNDITENLKAKMELKKSEKRFRQAIIHAPFPIIIHAEDGEILQINDTWTELTGYTHDQIPTMDDWIEKAYGEKKEIIRAIIERLYHLDCKVDDGEFTIKTAQGEEKTWQFNSSPLGRLSDGRRIVISMAIDVTQRKQAEEKLRYDALHDALTGLPNRLLLMERLAQSIERAKRHKNYRFALIFLDLDRFKIINDSLGHSIGDHLLILIASHLKNSVRAVDTVARLGGDEFIILLDDLQEEIEALHIADRIIEAIKTPFKIDNQEVFTTASLGIAFNKQENENADHILRNADLAMYKAKAQGKSRYVIFDQEMHAQAQKLLELETNLRLALKNQEFLLYYQPILSLSTQNLVGFEALVRWQHPQKGLISPDHFIPVAEEIGLIIPLGEWVLLESCRQLKRWQQQYSQLQHLKISVNLSSQQLKDHQIVEKIDNILSQTGLDPNCLKLEITESMLMENKSIARDILLQLRERGIEISIDDFGTGYSSLSYLHHLPVDSLKIDRSFVINMNQSEDNIRVTEAIITLAHHLQLDVIAEGIETEKDWHQLQELGCEFGQGYLFSKPLPSQEIEAKQFLFEF